MNSGFAIGNYVADLTTNKVVELSANDFAIMSSFQSVNSPIPYKGIRLSSEWLEFFGYDSSDPIIFYNGDGVGVRLSELKLKAVHELQNIINSLKVIGISEK